MTSRERLLAALRLQPVDRVPLHVRGVRPWDEQWVATRDASYAPLIAAVAEHGDYVDWWNAPAGTFYSAAPVPTEGWTEDRDDWVAHYTLHHTPGGDLRTMSLASKRGLPGMQMEFMVKDLADLDKVLSVPYEPARPDCAGYFAMADKMGERGLIMCGLHNAISMLHDTMGSELLALWSITERQRLMDLLWLFHRRCLDHVEYLVSQGVGPCFAMLGEEYVTPPLHSPHDFREFVVAPEQELAAAIHRAGHLLHIHCHGPLGNVLADGKRRVGQRMCLEGNIQIGDLYAGKTADIVAQMQHNLRVMDGQGYIICPTASPHTTVLTELTVRNYLAMIEAAR
jgi:hypothetical protein